MGATNPPDSMRTVRDVIESKARQYGEKTYLRYKDRKITFEELDRQTNIIANELLDRGISPGDHVCLLMYNSPEYVLTYFALAKIGVVIVPIDTRFTGETLSHVLSKTEANTILFDGKTQEEYESVREDVSEIKTEYFVGSDNVTQKYLPFDTLLDGEPDPPDVSVSGTDTISIIFVQEYDAEVPKGVVLPNYSYVYTGWEMSKNTIGYSDDERLFTNLPLYSIATFQLGAMGALTAGVQFVIEDPFDPDVFWDQVEHYDATTVIYLGRMLSVLYNREEAEKHKNNSLQRAIGHGFGFGFSTDKQLIKDFEKKFDLTIFEGYGATETGGVMSCNSPQERKVGSSGKAVTYAEVEIVDDHDRFLDAGESGEIVVRPSYPNTMFKHYYNDMEATVENCRNQWIHTGDIGYLDEDGFLHFIASKKNSIYRGQISGSISSLEIESVINTHPSVAESAVVGVQVSHGNEEIKAVVVPETDMDLTPVEVCSHCEQHLPRVEVPRYITIRNELPRSPTGKIKKGDLRQDLSANVWDRKSGYELSR